MVLVRDPGLIFTVGIEAVVDVGLLSCCCDEVAEGAAEFVRECVRDAKVDFDEEPTERSELTIADLERLCLPSFWCLFLELLPSLCVRRR